jgi:CDGSH-type Zn-finger protein/uncharacterized Fe-S cluster protein YjdI
MDLTMTTASDAAPTREQLLHWLYEAAELEHCLMCTYLYAAFSLKIDESDGLKAEQLEAVRRWRQIILRVAVEEMGHLLAVWNITAALGGAPRVGRENFPLDPGWLPAGVVVRLAPFDAATLQHFIYLERPRDSAEPDDERFAPELHFKRAIDGPLLTPMGTDYDTVGEFYDAIGAGLRRFAVSHGEDEAFCGNPALQIDADETPLRGAARVRCLKTALAALETIVAEGEGAQQASESSHFAAFLAIRTEYQALREQDPAFVPALPVATNPVLRRPQRPQGRVWLEDPRAVATVDLANACYGLMLRLFAYAYAAPVENADKTLAVDLATGLMHVLTFLAEHAARLPAGPSNPNSHAGVSFITLRDTAPLPGPAARRFFIERLAQLVAVATELARDKDARLQRAAALLNDLSKRAGVGFDLTARASPSPSKAAQDQANIAPVVAPPSTKSDDVESIEGKQLTLQYSGKRCIHARFCVTGGPKVFLANVEGDWIYPDEMPVDRLVEIAHACPSGAIRYKRHDGVADELAPPVNLASIRENGPYAMRGDLRIDGEAIGYRATLCRCGASKNKPFCDGSHHNINFHVTGEPDSGKTDMLAVRDGPLLIDPQINGPLRVRGNLEITSGTGRVVARITNANLCRCGASNNKPFCDGSHARVGFVSTV